MVDQKKKLRLYYKYTFFQVGEKWFCKLGFFFWFKKGGRPEKKSEWLQIKWLLGYTTLFYSNSISTKFQ